MWSVGDRVLGQRPEESFWYPGTVKHINGERFFVLFDDGEDALLAAGQLAALQLQVGDAVSVRLASGRDFVPATITGKDGDALQVRLEDGDQQWTTAARVRTDRSARRQSTPAATAIGSRAVGDVVLVCWHDLFWYPGVVLALRDEQAHVVLDDGNQILAPPEQLRPLTLEAGDRVEGRFQGGPLFFPGEVTRRTGGVVEVHYDDGDDETTLLRLLRLERDDWLPGETNWSEGDRVLGNWFDGHWYPGVVLAINGRRLQVLFDDGDQVLLAPGKLKRLNIQVGDRLCCRKQGGPAFYPCEITHKRGETIKVTYDDGDEETTTIRLVRLEREGFRDRLEQ